MQRNSYREIPGIVEQELQVGNEVNISLKIHQLWKSSLRLFEANTELRISACFWDNKFLIDSTLHKDKLGQKKGNSTKKPTTPTLWKLFG